MRAKSLQSCLTLSDPMDCGPPGSSVHGTLQARLLEWCAMPPPGDLPDPETEPRSLTSPALAGGFLTTSATWEAQVRPGSSLSLSQSGIPRSSNGDDLDGKKSKAIPRER